MSSAFLAPNTFLTHKRQLLSTRTCSTRRPPSCRVAEAKPSVQIATPAPVVQSLAERLRRDLQVFFDPSHPTDYSMYSPGFVFEDPLTKMRGVNKYEKHINFLERSILFSDAHFRLNDLRVVGDRLDIIRTRWYLSLTVNLPWRPCAAFTGQSDYVVDIQSGSICKQVDVWDSLHDSSFFSVAAVKDFVSQLLPNQRSLPQLRGFDLLRRTRDYEIRSFESSNCGAMFLEEQTDSTPVPTWSPSEAHGRNDGVFLKNVAVMKLSRIPRSKQEFAESERMLRYLLSNVPFAVVGNTCLYVQDVKGQLVHELWLELSEANARVDF